MTLGRKTRVNRNSEIRIGSSRNSFQTIILYLSGTQDFSRSLVYRTSDFAPSPRRQIKTTALSRDFYLAGHMTTELNFQRLSKGFRNVVLGRRYEDLRGLFKGKNALISGSKNETNETLFQVFGLSHFLEFSADVIGESSYFVASPALEVSRSFFQSPASRSAREPTRFRYLLARVS